MIIGILICGKSTKKFVNKFGNCGKIYREFLSSTENNFRYKFYNCHEGIFPDKYNISICRCFMITGSRYSAYENLEWINKLKELVRYLDNIKKKMVGICFGHQLIATALGCKVRENSKGWEVSRCRIELNDLGQTLLKKKSINHNESYLYIHQMHKDIVSDINEDSGLKLFCYNEMCNNQGMIKENHILTFQGHPEYFAHPIVTLLNQRRNIIDKMIVSDGIKRSNWHTDKDILLAIIINFIGF